RRDLRRRSRSRQRAGVGRDEPGVVDSQVRAPPRVLWVLDVHILNRSGIWALDEEDDRVVVPHHGVTARGERPDRAEVGPLPRLEIHDEQLEPGPARGQLTRGAGEGGARLA